MKRLLPLFLAFAAAAGARADGRDDPAALQARAEALVKREQARVPAYALLAAQQAGFEASWREQVRRQLAIGNDRQAQKANDAIALDLALNAANAYLDRAGDAAVDAYFQQQRRLLGLAQDDLRLCRLILNTPATRDDRNGSPPWLLEKPYRALAPELRRAVAQVVVDAQGKPPRRLPADQSQLFMQRVLERMSARYGPQALARYERLQNENAGPAERCGGLQQLLETINEEPLELRAALVRGYFGH